MTTARLPMMDLRCPAAGLNPWCDYCTQYVNNCGLDETGCLGFGGEAKPRCHVQAVNRNGTCNCNGDTSRPADRVHRAPEEPGDVHVCVAGSRASTRAGASAKTPAGSGSPSVPPRGRAFVNEPAAPACPPPQAGGAARFAGIDLTPDLIDINLIAARCLDLDD